MNLNKSQKRAVEHKGGPLLIIAGAGTGKTSVITEKILYLIKTNQARPSEILALTFTEKAADEMQERIDIAMPYGYEEPNISTFHSFCDQVLKRDGYQIGLDTNYSLLSSAQGYIFMKKHLYDLPLDIFRPKGNPAKFLNDLLDHFSRLQDEDVSPEEYVEFAKNLPQSTKEEKETRNKLLELSNVYLKYTELKVQESKMDFGDLIIFTLKLFRENPEILEKYRKQYKYILVDEFQDTNYTQNVLVNTMSLGLKDGKIDVGNKERPNLTVVGDDDQAIYKFRGAAISNILQFKEVYKDSEEVVLTENYRSHQEILDSAYRLITKNNPNRLEETEGIDKKLVARSEFQTIDDDRVQLIVAENEQKEAEKIAQKILELTGRENNVETEGVFDESGQSKFVDNENEEGRYKNSDIAILARANKHVDAVAQALRVKGIPYKLGGSRGLYSRPEIKTLIAYLRLLTNPEDSKSAFKLLSIEQMKISPKELVKLGSEAKKNNNSILEELEDMWNIQLGTEKDPKADNKREFFSNESILSISNLLVVMNEAMFKIKEGRSITEILFLFMKNTGYLESFMQEDSAEKMFQVSNMHKFLELVKEYETENKDTDIFEYVDYLNYCMEVGESPLVDQTDLSEYDAVNILTVHGAKGLEFPVVFMINLVKDRFPGRNQSDTIPLPRELIKEDLVVEDEKKSHLQEERRLFYVGATRAKAKLFLTAAKFYSGGVRKKKPSIFLNEILDRSLEEAFKEEKGKTENSFDEYSGSDEEEQGKLEERYQLGRVSYSQVNRYQDCPKKYEYSYVYKIPTPPTGSLAFGSTIHNTLKSFYELHKRSIGSLEGVNEKPDIKTLLEMYERSWISSGYGSKEEEKERKKSGEKALKEFYNSLYKEGDNPIGLEESFGISIGDVSFVGKIDRIDLVEKGKESIVEIIDYKTGKVKEKEEIKRDLQLPLYAIAAERTMGVKVAKASYLFIEHGEKVEVDISPERRLSAEKELLKTVENIKQNKFNPTPGFLCRFCDFNDICEDAQL